MSQAGEVALFDYIKMLELEEPIKQMKIIHVAGTKGKSKDSLDGMDICEEKFLAYFWWCFDRFKERTTDEVPMPTYFRFLALLAFKIFAAEQVQNPVVCGISSLGYDHMEILDTNPNLNTVDRREVSPMHENAKLYPPIMLSQASYVETPVTEILLDKLLERRQESFKVGGTITSIESASFTVPSSDEAMLVLEEKA
ncbi:hypothetical protein HAX54_000012 [Datura stramonium]|uniref:Uncharacterized protein n=1 Tax=Datura stramonium TaxID=4076 RepID=A0ABS8RFL2_DATST|nr:hypothetical protein [Datura stramonium]